jgi:hypothetical protein
MSELELALSIPRNTLVVQESPRCELVGRNAGSAPLKVARPGLHPEWPTLEVRGPGEGDERAFTPEERWRARPVPMWPGETSIMELAAGAERREWVRLLDRIDLPRVGRYSIEATELVGEVWCRSAPVELEVAPLRPIASTRPIDEGGVWSMAWVQEMEGAPSELHVRALRSVRGRVVPVAAFRAAAPISKEARPALSAPPLGATPPARFVAWVERGRGGDLLRWTSVLAEPSDDAAAVVLPADSTLLGTLALVDPERPRALALTLADGSLLPTWIGEAEPTVGAAVRVPFGPPVWSDVVVGPDRRATLVALAEEEGALKLHALPVSDGVPGAIVTLGVCKGAFAAAAATVDATGRVRGAVLTWFAKREGEVAVPLLTRFTLEVDGRARLETPALWPWDRRWRADEALLRLDAAGAPHLLVREAEVGWLQAGPLALPRPCAPPGSDVVALDLLFMNETPVVLATDPSTGVRDLAHAEVR